MISNSFSYAFGPLVAVGVLVVLVFFLRWAFGGKKTSLVVRVKEAGGIDEYGVLVPVYFPKNWVEGEKVKYFLEQEGVRSTLAETLEGLRIFVFPSQAEHARGIVSQKIHTENM